MVSGFQVRMSRITRGGRMLAIPMDHGISNGPIEGLEDPHQTAYTCERGGITAIIINKGILKSMPKPPGVGVLVHFSASTSRSSSPNRKMITGTVEEAIRMGADGVSLHINIGGKEEPEMLEQLGAAAERCQAWGVPLLAMMYPRGENVPDPHEPGVVAHAARIGAECGADIVKTVYTGDTESFGRVVRSTPVPVVVAGGPRASDDLELLQMAEQAMSAGAAGMTFGRNVFAHKSPADMSRALADVVFDGVSAQEAVKRLG